MKIISLTSENVKKLTVVEIRPDGNLVQITGRNGQGKSSVLDSIWWALAGAKNIQSAPIRKGATEARIRLDLGEIVVTRTFRDGEGGATTKISVETAAGFRAGKPQQILDDLLGSLSFDPLAFTRMDAKKQFDELRQFVPGVDFDQIEADNKRDFDQRTDINRNAKASRNAAEAIQVPAGLPDAEIDETALVAQLEQAGQHNAAIETRKTRRVEAVAKVESLLAERDLVFQEEKALRDRAAEILKQADGLHAAAGAKQTEAMGLQEKINTAEELPASVDTVALRQQIEEARGTNACIAKRTDRSNYIMRAEQLEAAAKGLTEAMEARIKSKEAAISSAELPVDGITFGAGSILLNGLPFDQASDAEQLRASISIAMASNPALRVIRVRDGSLLDEEGMTLLGEMADKHDCQVWIERVDSSGKVGFVLEDGHLKAPSSDIMAAE